MYTKNNNQSCESMNVRIICVLISLMCISKGSPLEIGEYLSSVGQSLYAAGDWKSDATNNPNLSNITLTVPCISSDEYRADVGMIFTSRLLQFPTTTTFGLKSIETHSFSFVSRETGNTAIIVNLKVTCPMGSELKNANANSCNECVAGGLTLETSLAFNALITSLNNSLSTTSTTGKRLTLIQNSDLIALGTYAKAVSAAERFGYFNQTIDLVVVPSLPATQHGEVTTAPQGWVVNTNGTLRVSSPKGFALVLTIEKLGFGTDLSGFKFALNMCKHTDVNNRSCFSTLHPNALNLLNSVGLESNTHYYRNTSSDEKVYVENACPIIISGNSEENVQFSLSLKTPSIPPRCNVTADKCNTGMKVSWYAIPLDQVGSIPHTVCIDVNSTQGLSVKNLPYGTSSSPMVNILSTSNHHRRTQHNSPIRVESDAGSRRLLSHESSNPTTRCPTDHPIWGPGQISKQGCPSNCNFLLTWPYCGPKASPNYPRSEYTCAYQSHNKTACANIPYCEYLQHKLPISVTEHTATVHRITFAPMSGNNFETLNVVDNVSNCSCTSNAAVEAKFEYNNGTIANVHNISTTQTCDNPDGHTYGNWCYISPYSSTDLTKRCAPSNGYRTNWRECQRKDEIITLKCKRAWSFAGDVFNGCAMPDSSFQKQPWCMVQENKYDYKWAYCNQNYTTDHITTSQLVETQLNSTLHNNLPEMPWLTREETMGICVGKCFRNHASGCPWWDYKCWQISGVSTNANNLRQSCIAQGTTNYECTYEDWGRCYDTYVNYLHTRTDLPEVLRTRGLDSDEMMERAGEIGLLYPNENKMARGAVLLKPGDTCNNKTAIVVSSSIPLHIYDYEFPTDAQYNGLPCLGFSECGFTHQIGCFKLPHTSANDTQGCTSTLQSKNLSLYNICLHKANEQQQIENNANAKRNRELKALDSLEKNEGTQQLRYKLETSLSNLAQSTTEQINLLKNQYMLDVDLMATAERLMIPLAYKYMYICKSRLPHLLLCTSFNTNQIPVECQRFLDCKKQALSLVNHRLLEEKNQRLTPVAQGLMNYNFKQIMESNGFLRVGSIVATTIKDNINRGNLDQLGITTSISDNAGDVKGMTVFDKWNMIENIVKSFSGTPGYAVGEDAVNRLSLTNTFKNEIRAKPSYCTHPIFKSLVIDRFNIKACMSTRRSGDNVLENTEITSFVSTPEYTITTSCPPNTYALLRPNSSVPIKIAEFIGLGNGHVCANAYMYANLTAYNMSITCPLFGNTLPSANSYTCPNGLVADSLEYCFPSTYVYYFNSGTEGLMASTTVCIGEQRPGTPNISDLSHVHDLTSTIIRDQVKSQYSTNLRSGCDVIREAYQTYMVSQNQTCCS